MLLRGLCGKTYEHYDMVKDLIGDSAARGQYVHRGTAQSIATTTSLETPDEQESANSLGNIISNVTPLSAASGGLATLAASATSAFTQLLSNSELDHTSITSHPSAHRATSPMDIDPSSAPSQSVHDFQSPPPPSILNYKSPSLSARNSERSLSFIRNSGLPPPSGSAGLSLSGTVSSGHKRKRDLVETEDVKTSASRRSKCSTTDSKPAGTLAAFVRMSLNQTASLSDASVVQRAMSLISTKADYLSNPDKGLFFNTIHEIQLPQLFCSLSMR
jgi:hypothetical protein